MDGMKVAFTPAQGALPVIATDTVVLPANVISALVSVASVLLLQIDTQASLVYEFPRRIADDSEGLRSGVQPCGTWIGSSENRLPRQNFPGALVDCACC
jgi:hypothetical protein